MIKNNNIKGSLISYFAQKAMQTKGVINLAQGKPNFSPSQSLKEHLS